MNDNPDVQAVGLLLLLSFCAALIIVGILVSKTRLWGARRGDRGASARAAGFLMTVSGSIIGSIVLLYFIYSQIINKYF